MRHHLMDILIAVLVFFSVNMKTVVTGLSLTVELITLVIVLIKLYDIIQERKSKKI